VRTTGGRLFDDAESHEEEALFHAWNDAQARRRPLLIIADAPPPQWQIALPDLRSRLAATSHVELGPPDDILIRDLIIKLLGDRGIAAPPELAEYLVPRIERSHVAVLAVVERLDHATLSHNKRITIPLARKVLDGAGMIGRAKG
jgi:chromosomal replication initiation ATPase DnaA